MPVDGISIATLFPFDSCSVYCDFACIKRKINTILISCLYSESWDTINKSRNQLEVKAHACKKNR